jgi:hypothetical protein
MKYYDMLITLRSDVNKCTRIFYDRVKYYHVFHTYDKAIKYIFYVTIVTQILGRFQDFIS